jgi:hypothetical protein
MTLEEALKHCHLAQGYGAATFAKGLHSKDFRGVAAM